MRIAVSLHGFGRSSEATAEVAEGATYLDLLKALDIPPESVVGFANDAPVPDDAPIRTEASVRLVRVISGGVRRADR